MTEKIRKERRKYFCSYKYRWYLPITLLGHSTFSLVLKLRVTTKEVIENGTWLHLVGGVGTVVVGCGGCVRILDLGYEKSFVGTIKDLYRNSFT